MSPRSIRSRCALRREMLASMASRSESRTARTTSCSRTCRSRRSKASTATSSSLRAFSRARLRWPFRVRMPGAVRAGPQLFFESLARLLDEVGVVVAFEETLVRAEEEIAGKLRKLLEARAEVADDPGRQVV